MAIGLAMMVFATLVTRLPYFGDPAADFDEQLYSLIGSQMRHGMLPYVDLWDRKPIGLFLVYAFAHAIGGDTPVSFQVLALLACLIGGWQVWRLGCRIVDPQTAALGAALYPMLMALFDIHSGQSEIFLVPLIMAMAQLLLIAADKPVPSARKLCMAAMLLGGIALQIKYTALFQCLFFGGIALWLLRRQDEPIAQLSIDAVIFAALGIAPTVLAALYYAVAGEFSEFVFANFQSIGLRSAMPLSRMWLDQLLFAIPVMALAGGGMFAVWCRQTPGWPPLWRFAVLWLGMSIVGLFMVRTIYPYYYAALAPAAILVSLPMFAGRHIGSIVWAVVFLGMLAGFNPPARLVAVMHDRDVLSQMANALAPHVENNRNCLYVFDGPTALYRLTGSGLPTRVIYPDHLNNALEARALPVKPELEIARIFFNRPGAVVTSSDSVTEQNFATSAVVSQELAAHYRPLGQWLFQDRRLNLFARLPDSDGLTPSCQ